MKTILLKELSPTKRVGVIIAELWFKDFKLYYPVLPNDFVVGSWEDFHDGQKSNIEGLTTIAIFRSVIDAEIFLNTIKE